MRRVLKFPRWHLAGALLSTTAFILCGMSLERTRQHGLAEASSAAERIERMRLRASLLARFTDEALRLRREAVMIRDNQGHATDAWPTLVPRLRLPWSLEGRGTGGVRLRVTGGDVPLGRWQDVMHDVATIEASQIGELAAFSATASGAEKAGVFEEVTVSIAKI